MKASDKDVLTTQLYFGAAFKAMGVPLVENPKHAKAFEKVNMVVEFRAADDANPLACYMVFLTEDQAALAESGKRFKVYQGEYPGSIKLADGSDYSPTHIKMYFKSIKSVLGVFKGNSPTDMLGIMAPLFKNILKPGMLKFLFLMLELMKAMPSFTPGPDKPFEQYMKVKISLYLITAAMSTANKLGWEDMTTFTKRQTDRIYQFHVGATLDENGKEIYPEIGAYLRVKAGQTKAGRGVYTRKRPFVLFEFPNPDGCMAILTNKYPFVECVEKGCVEIIGSGDSFAVQFNNVMTRCQNLLIPDPKPEKE